MKYVYLFGDGAAAAIVTYDDTGNSKYLNGLQKTYSEGAYLARIDGGGLKNPYRNHVYNQELYSFKMEGKKLLRLAKKKIPPFMNEFFSGLNISIEEVDHIIPHQASKTGMMIFEKLYPKLKGEVHNTLLNYGNCIAASIPLTLASIIESGKLKRGETCLLCGTSAGFSIGGVLLVF